ncbi:MAG: DUF4097 family beta strand repeat-containing protein [Candidatus Methanoperedens sp.]|nr:DUF4097 family beta strand repeat-containing protein [Candidatus Methanoperedens sp.]
MIATIALGLVLALPQEGQGTSTDTTVTVRPGARLEMHNMAGDIEVKTWDRNAVRVQAEHSSRDHVEISYGGVVLRVGASGRRGPAHAVDYIITVPAAMDLNLSGNYGDISVEGSTGRIVVETVQGGVTVKGGRSLVTLHSVEGDVAASGVVGRLEINSTNGEATVDDVEGEVYVEGVNGDVTLSGIRSDNVNATTVNGDVIYRGTVRDDGQYRLSTHNGDISVSVPGTTNATVTVSTFSGDFESDFPVTLTGARQGKRFTFTLGSGRATMELESFQGSIRLVRP